MLNANSKEDVDSVNRAALFDKETSVEMKLLGEAIVRKEDLISSNRNVSALATLYRSVVSIFPSLGMC